MAAAVREKTQVFFEQFNNFFDHIYVITLERAKDRHQHIKTELDGLEYELFFGIDKEKFTIEELLHQKIYSDALAKKHHRYGKAMRPGEIGCAWSHVEVYKDVVAKGHKKVLILEDDVVIDWSNASLLPSILLQLPKDWELLYFGFAERERRKPSHFFKKLLYHLLRVVRLFPFTHRTINNLYPKKITANIFTAGYHDCTHAYAISKQAAETLLGLQQPISFIADNLLAYAITNRLINGYAVHPKLINQQYQVGEHSVSYLNQ